MKEFIDTYFKWLSKVGIIIIIISSFFLFTNLTTEFYDTAKFLVLLVITGILLVLVCVRFTLNNKVVLVRTPLDIPLLLFLAVAIISTLLSSAPFVGLLGNQLRLHGSLSSLVIYVLFYFVLVNLLKSQKEVKWVFSIAIISGLVLSVITLISYAGVKVLPPPWNHGINFTPTGSSFSTSAILALLIPIVALQILQGRNLVLNLLNSLALTIFGVTITLTGSPPTWIAGVLGLILSVWVSPLSKVRSLNQIKPITIISFIIPVTIVLLVTLLSFIPPIGGAKNPLYDQARNFPRELQLGFIPSWKISVSAFRDAPFWGSGPSTYLFDFTNYKPFEINSSNIWNLRFDSAFNEYLQVLATLGGVGLIALLSLTALFISSAYSSIKTHNLGGELKTALAISGLLFFVILALHTSTLVVWVFGLLILASYFVVNLSSNPSRGWGNLLKFAQNITSSNSSEETIRIEALPSVLLTICLVLTLFGFYFAGKFALADYHHRVALNAVSQNQGVIAYNELVASEKLNPYSDLYRLDLAQTNFALANAIAQSKAPTESSPSGSLTDTDKQNIQVLLQQSISEGRTATSLSPRSALNWEILGLLYRQIAGVAQNALTFSLDAYGRAIIQDPLNPQLRLSVGGVYYAVQNFDLAIRFFTDAINLKPDFANAYYNFSVALRDKGDLTNAQAAAEKLLTLVDKSSPDYKVANDYLTDLKNRIASGSAQQSQIKPPAAQTNGSLQQKELPKVVNVGTPPEKIATPEAIKKPNSTPEPTSNP